MDAVHELHSLPSNNHLETVCIKAPRCAFLMTSAGGLKCGKNSVSEATIKQWIARGLIRASGNHCSGFPDFIPSKTT